MIGEPSDTKTFRIGLFGLDKIRDLDQDGERLRAGARPGGAGVARREPVGLHQGRCEIEEGDAAGVESF